MKRFTAPLVALTAGTTLLLGSHPVQAHGSAAGGLLGGLGHPLLGLDHLLMLLAVGAAASLLSARLLLWAGAGALVGAALGLGGFRLPAAEPLAALAIAAMGGLTLLALTSGPASRSSVLTGLGGLLVATGVSLHALLHGLEAPRDATNPLWWSGALISSVLVCGGGWALFRILPHRWARVAAVAFLASGVGLALAPLGLLVGSGA